MDYGIVIEKIHQELKAYWGKGKVADYIPALAGVEPKRYGIAIETLDGHSFQVGDADIRFSIQSISKVFALAMVTRHLGDRIWKFVGREPSGNPFNSLVQLEYEHGIPRNPFINAGALVVTDRLMNSLKMLFSNLSEVYVAMTISTMINTLPARNVNMRTGTWLWAI